MTYDGGTALPTDYYDKEARDNAIEKLREAFAVSAL
jgi:hypothetical protein